MSTCFQLALALSALHSIAGACQDVEDVDVALAVSAAQCTDDGAVRAAALRLVTLLAGRAPSETLAHVLQVVHMQGCAACIDHGYVLWLHVHEDVCLTVRCINCHQLHQLLTAVDQVPNTC